MPDVLSNEDLNALAGEYVLGTLDYDERKGASALLEVDPTFRGIVRIWEKRLGELHLMVEAVEPDPQLWERIKPKAAATEQLPVAIAPDPAEMAPEPDAETTAATAVPADNETPLPETESAASPEAESQPEGPAALEPVAAEQGGPETPSASESAPADEQSQTAAEIERGFVPPPPMIRRSSPEPSQPVRKSGRGWMAASLVLGLVAIVLAGLIGAWRFFPERLPAKLRAYSVLNIPAPEPSEPPAQSPPPPPPPAPFLE